jgi:SNF2 family DNA or RNA helicase
VILDEAHYIKNPRAKVTRSAQQLNSRYRLCLTGTPLENNLSELWSIFNFLLPGFLGKLEQFRHTFQIPIEKNADTTKREALIQRTKPFLLRRTKQAVLTELPPKTEILLPVEMEDEQRDFYESIRISVQQKVLQAIGEKGLERSQITVLEALLRLRQVCCDPRLVKIKAAKERNTPSAKLTLLIEMLTNLVAEGRRVIVFSQFTQMLDLIAKELQCQQLPFVSLTGQTKERAPVIASFQEGEVPIFLLSLKAGGIGLNLTAADTIIHYDPWWNPAVERQATDRAHRIGQDKPIFVYKLVMKGTVEEKIVALQHRKQALLDDLITESGNTSLTTSDLEALFAPLDAS